MSKPDKSFLREDLFVPLEKIFSLGGIWPLKPTYVRFTICITYFTLHLAMAYADFFFIFGNLELMIIDIVESLIYSVTYTMVWVIRCSTALRRIIAIVKQDISTRKAESVEEENLYYNFYYISKMFAKGSIIGIAVSVIGLYLRPILTHTWMIPGENGTVEYTLPFRIRLFFPLNNFRTFVLTYLYLSPMMYMSVCHMTSISVLVLLVLHVCGEMAVLSSRIRNINTDSAEVATNSIRRFVKAHLKITGMAKSLDETFNIVLLDELLGNSIILAICMYYVLLNLEASKLTDTATFGLNAAMALIMLYGYCLVGEQLLQQSLTMQDAYYHCNWQILPTECKKSMLICMIRSKLMLQLTAGKFYVFCLSGFTDVVKSSMAYLSMIKTMLMR